MSRARRRARAAAFLTAFCTAVACESLAAETRPLPPRPDTTLGPVLLATSPIDAASPCPEEGLRPEVARRIASAREAATAEERVIERRTLRDLLSGPLPLRDARCATQELARIELLLGLHPEAAASARRIVDIEADSEPAPELVAASEMLRAEALYASGHARAAESLYRAHAESGDVRIAAAARLRLADVRFDTADRARALPEYEVLLERAESFGAEGIRWAPRAAEAAIAAGDLASAETWLERLVAGAVSDREEALFSIRLADVLVAKGEPRRARDLLTELDEIHKGTPEGLLARLRIFDWKLERVPEERAIQALRQAVADVRHPGLATYARSLLARRLLVAREIDDAIPLLIRVSYDSITPGLRAASREQLEGALLLAAEDPEGAGCKRLVWRLGDRRALLMRRTRDPLPFLRLGECYEELGLPLAALEVYRGMTRRFGAAVVEGVSLPIGRASLAAGDLPAARSAAGARVSAAERARRPVGPSWRLLLSRVQLAEGDAAAAAEQLTVLAREEPELSTLLLLARAAREAPDSEASRRLLYDALVALEPAEDSAADYAQAAELAAGLHRRTGERERARILYERALAHWPADSSRSAAAYWLGVLSAEGERTRASLDDAAEAGREAPFPRLARNRIAIDDLRSRIGLTDADIEEGRL